MLITARSSGFVSHVYSRIMSPFLFAATCMKTCLNVCMNVSSGVRPENLCKHWRWPRCDVARWSFRCQWKSTWVSLLIICQDALFLSCSLCFVSAFIVLFFCFFKYCFLSVSSDAQVLALLSLKNTFLVAGRAWHRIVSRWTRPDKTLCFSPWSKSNGSITKSIR